MWAWQHSLADVCIFQGALCLGNISLCELNVRVFSSLSLEGCDHLTDASLAAVSRSVHLRSLNVATCRQLSDAGNIFSKHHRWAVLPTQFAQGLMNLRSLCQSQTLCNLNVSMCTRISRSAFLDSHTFVAFIDCAAVMRCICCLKPGA